MITNYPLHFIRNTQYILNDITNDKDKINKIIDKLTLSFDMYKETNIVEYNLSLKKILIKNKYFPIPIVNFITKYK